MSTATQPKLVIFDDKQFIEDVERDRRERHMLVKELCYAINVCHHVYSGIISNRRKLDIQTMASLAVWSGLNISDYVKKFDV